MYFVPAVLKPIFEDHPDIPRALAFKKTETHNVSTQSDRLPKKENSVFIDSPSRCPKTV